MSKALEYLSSDEAHELFTKTFNPALIQLRKEATEGLQHNAEAIEKRGEALKEAGAFRTEIPPKGFRRAHHAKFSGEVHQVANVDGAAVTDAQGREFATKFVRPVPAGSASVETAAAAGAGESGDGTGEGDGAGLSGATGEGQSSSCRPFSSS